MDHQLNQFSNISAGCERIYNTPLPFAHSVLLHRTEYLYCFWFPFGLDDAPNCPADQLYVYCS